MTRQEAIKVLNMVEAHGIADEAKRMAIEALSAETPTIQEKHQLSEETPTVFIDGIGHFPKLTETSQNLTEPNNTCEVDLISRADAIEAVRKSEHRITIADEQGGVGTVKWDMWGVYTAEAVEAIHALPSAEAEWIPCSERLPEDTARPVLISGRHKTVGIYAVDIARYNGGMWQNDGFTFPDCEILAWMPLPEPYKGGEEEPGQWQTEDGRKTKAEYSVYCSKCGSWSEYRTKYCGNCGSLMKEENDVK